MVTDGAMKEFGLKNRQTINLEIHTAILEFELSRIEATLACQEAMKS